MIIVATYANRKYDPEVVELVCAWDEFSIESNYDGWKKEHDEALASWGDDLLRWVDVEIDVPMKPVLAVLDPEVSVVPDMVSVMEKDDNEENDA